MSFRAYVLSERDFQKEEQMITVALDAMGGDNAPAAIVQGALEAVRDCSELVVKLVGPKGVIQKELAGKTYPADQIQIVEASQVIETEEPPVMAIRTKKDSSIVVGLGLVRKKEADAFVSSGSTGAVLVGGQLIVGKIKGVKRPPLAPLIPTEKGVSLLIDCGANVDARSEHLLQFAKMGSIYMQYVVGVEKPRVALVNIGAEEEKGNALVKETMPLLKECDDIHFTGSIEARDIPKGGADVIVCEAFVGNVILKVMEGTGKVLIHQIKDALLSNLQGKIGALLIRKNLKQVVKRFDASEYGGAPMLGLNGLVVKAHGSAKSKEIRNTLLQCVTFHQQQINKKIEKAFMVNI